LQDKQALKLLLPPGGLFIRIGPFRAARLFHTKEPV